MRNVNPTLMIRICSVCLLALATGGCSYTPGPEAPEVAPVEFELHGADKEDYLDILQLSEALKEEDASIRGLAQEIKELREQYVSAATPADQERYAPLLKNKTSEIVQRLLEHEQSYRSLGGRLSELFERLRQRRSGSAAGAPVQVERECGSTALPIGSILDHRCRPESGDNSLREVETDGVVASNPRGLALSAASLERRWRVVLAQAEELETYAYQYRFLLDQLNQGAIQRLHDCLDDRGTLNPQNPDFYLLGQPAP
ncbi:MAG: hypothetical protein OXU54_05120 [Gammaproteobacteria bacterium]|nr:hypothetical protein [Gammaproteobacteria bacterium]